MYRFDGVTGNFIDIFIPTGSCGGYQHKAGHFPPFCPYSNSAIKSRGGFQTRPYWLAGCPASQGNDSVLQYNRTTSAFIDTFVLPASGGLDELSDLLFYTSSTPIPEPATMLHLGSGLIGLAGFRKKLKK
ncbi:MAG: PEP-CTERM sorting domain-containing protein [Deltaproteobacteria bacterium]|nr:PEP-CTERM sorting domain-containing protein [Deltaproteobacteria bacterium]